jgi:hypothetical protein
MRRQRNTISGLPKYWELERRTVAKDATPAKKLSPPVLLLAGMGLAGVGLAGVGPLAARSSQVPWLCCVAVCSAWLWSCCSGSGRWTWHSLGQCRPAPGGALPPCVAHFYAPVSFVAFGQSGRTLLWVVAGVYHTRNWLIGSTRCAAIPSAYINTLCYGPGLCRARISPGSVRGLAKPEPTSCLVMACYPLQSRMPLPTLHPCALSGLYQRFLLPVRLRRQWLYLRPGDSHAS